MDRLTSPHAVRTATHDLRIDFEEIRRSSIAAGLGADRAPMLSIVVDCEEEFDWQSPIRGTAYGLRSVAPLRRVAETLARQDAALTVMTTYSIVRHDESWQVLNTIAKDFGAAIGAHLHAWMTPPFVEEPTLQNSYQGNLTREVEASKIETLLSAISDRTGEPVRLFRAGRYGFGASTAEFLAARGIEIDLSFMPHFDYTDSGGNSFTDVPCDPFWFGPDLRLFEFPMTAGFTGWMKDHGPALFTKFNARSVRHLRLPSVLANSGLLNRVRLSPEGVTLEEAKALTRSLFQQGHRLFHLSFHSTSLVPGAAPYVATDDEAHHLVSWLSQYIAFFQQELSGSVVTPAIAEAAARAALPDPQPKVESVRPAAAVASGAYEDPRVSVIIPTYNRADLVGRAVQSALDQTYPVSEIIVVDDGSRDATRSVLEPFSDRIHYIYQENQGVSMARNRALREASGELVAFLDSDDMWEPWKMEMQVSCFRRYPHLVMLGTNGWAENEHGAIRPDFMRSYSVHRSYAHVRDRFTECQIEANGSLVPMFYGDFSSPMFLGNFFVTPTVVVRRDVLNKAGLFDVAMRNAGEDYDLFWRICELGHAGVIDVPAVRFRRGGGDHLHANPQMALSNMRAIDRFMRQHPNGPELPPDLIARRLADSYAWVGRALFDHDRPVEARPYLREAIKRGAGSPRIRVYEAFTWMPDWTIPAARRVMQGIRRARILG